MSSQTFWNEIQFRTIFIWSFFWSHAYFWQHWAVNWMYFSISVQNNISTISIFQSPSSTLRENICARGLVCMKFNSKQLLFQAFFDIMRIFGSIEPQSELNFPFLYIICSKLHVNRVIYPYFLITSCLNVMYRFKWTILRL